MHQRVYLVHNVMLPVLAQILVKPMVCPKQVNSSIGGGGGGEGSSATNLEYISILRSLIFDKASAVMAHCSSSIGLLLFFCERGDGGIMEAGGVESQKPGRWMACMCVSVSVCMVGGASERSLRFPDWDQEVQRGGGGY